MRKATQQWAVAQADLRSTRHQLKVLQQQVHNRMLSISLLAYRSGFNVGPILYKFAALRNIANDLLRTLW